MVNASNITLLKQLNTDTLGQLKNVLMQIDQRLYTHVNSKGRASVGQHVRHTLEFYQCLVDASGSVNYDARKRDIMIESSASHAAHVVDEIMERINSFIEDVPMKMLAEMPGSENLVNVASSLSRELLYVLEHAIHHMALMRILIKDEASDFELDDTFGVAYSTLAYRSQHND